MKFLFLLLTASLLAKAQIYVSPTGNDTNAGTRDHPIRTLEQARDLVRRMNHKTVYLAGGTYRLSSPLTLTPQDSGVTYAALPGQKPVIGGGIAVTGWKCIDANRNLWSSPAPPELKNTRQLYVNGVRAQRARGRLPVTLTETETGLHGKFSRHGELEKRLRYRVCLHRRQCRMVGEIIGSRRLDRTPLSNRVDQWNQHHNGAALLG